MPSDIVSSQPVAPPIQFYFNLTLPPVASPVATPTPVTPAPITLPSTAPSASPSTAPVKATAPVKLVNLEFSPLGLALGIIAGILAALLAAGGIFAYFCSPFANAPRPV